MVRKIISNNRKMAGQINSVHRLEKNRNSSGICRLTVYLMVLLTVSMYARAEDSVRLIVAGTRQAIVEVNGDRHILRLGELNSGEIRLVSTDSEKVVILFKGKEMVFNTFAGAMLIYDDSQQQKRPTNSAVLWAEPNGFFYADATIDGKPVRFLVDTGANIVTLNGTLADRLGIDYSQGSIEYATTASGIVAVRALYIENITLQGITLFDIPVTVVPGPFPETPLLGGSFLNHLNMSRVGNRMELTGP